MMQHRGEKKKKKKKEGLGTYQSQARATCGRFGLGGARTEVSAGSDEGDTKVPPVCPLLLLPVSDWGVPTNVVNIKR